MARPILDAVVREAATWLSSLNDNFEKLMDAPFPIVSVVDVGTLASTHNAKLYQDCIAEAGGVLYKSDGAVWKVFRERVALLADLDPGTATETTIRTALNTLLSGLKSKGWMN